MTPKVSKETTVSSYAVELLVKAVLKSPHGLAWSVQGLGMLRTYLADHTRLHIWDSKLRIPNVSPIHDHPWDLASLIVAGVMRQYRYTPSGGLSTQPKEHFHCAKIKCGEGAYVLEEPYLVSLSPHSLEQYEAGETYMQHSYEIHESLPEDGTVTLVRRSFKENREEARVFWRGNSGWVDAAPRPATEEEVETVTQAALARWF